MITPSLIQVHTDHLRSEGFSPEQIDFLAKLGVRSINDTQARQLGLSARCDRLGKAVNPPGLYFPFNKDFGQVRCDTPPIRDGKPAKYITTRGKKASAWLPDDCQVITEGFKDAASGTLHGEIPTGAIAGVSHYKCLPHGSGHTIVFDADGWENLQVFAQLIHAGAWLGGKVALLPVIEGQPKAGLCEYFKAGNTKADYQNLIASALKPEDLLQKWPDYWDGFGNRQTVRCCRLAACLGSLYLTELESEAFIRRLADRFKGYGVRARDLQREVRRWKFRRQKKKAVPRLTQDYRTIERRFGKALRFNTLTSMPELCGKPFPAEEARLKWLVDYELSIKSPKEDCIEIALSIAKKQPFNPVADYLKQCHKQYGDDISILSGLADRYLGNDEEITQTQLIKTLIRAVARAFEPGCKSDEVTVLAGPQGFGKSEFLKALASPTWFCDDFSDPRDKDHLLKLHESWIVEWAELHGLGKREVTKVKAFITTARDLIRKPYDPRSKHLPRPSIMVGTSNDAEFLTDATGNRRWWIIKVGQRIPVELVKEERDLIWAAAVVLYERGEPWWLDDGQEHQAEVVRKGYEAIDPWHELISTYVSDKSEVSIKDIFVGCLEVDKGLQDHPKNNRIVNILKRLGWEVLPNPVWRDKNRVRVWARKDASDTPPWPTKTEGVSEGVSVKTFIQQEIQSSDTADTADTLEKRVGKTETISVGVLVGQNNGQKSGGQTDFQVGDPVEVLVGDLWEAGFTVASPDARQWNPETNKAEPTYRLEREGKESRRVLLRYIRPCTATEILSSLTDRQTA
jgi:predicted P-loop ATPase